MLRRDTRPRLGHDPYPQHDTGEFPGPWNQYETKVIDGEYVTTIVRLRA